MFICEFDFVPGRIPADLYCLPADASARLRTLPQASKKAKMRKKTYSNYNLTCNLIANVFSEL